MLNCQPFPTSRLPFFYSSHYHSLHSPSSLLQLLLRNSTINSHFARIVVTKISADPLANMDYFDHIDDLLDFPEDHKRSSSNTNTAFSGVWNASFPHTLLNRDLDFKGIGTGCNTDLAAELSIPYEDIVQMEWFSMFMEDSVGDGNNMTLDRRDFPVADDGVVAPIQFHSLSPVSILESSVSSSSSTSSCSEVGKILHISLDNACNRGGWGRARSKRARPPNFNIESAMQLIAPDQSFIDNFGVCGEELNESYSLKKSSEAAGKKKIKKSAKPLCPMEISLNESSDEQAASEPQGVRKCLHCEITKTPQWRAGPLGPKTLCNACGVRYKSGRLYPEYRPAASPTFVPSLHSNSHKKVLEMRTTTTLDDPFTSMSEDLTICDDSQPEFISNKDALLY